ncbi:MULTISPECIES: proton-conducting transporter membrane subunit [Acidiplasma]|jgi:hydrogenase-4 component F|uniref:proton-conducting transporter transmembrane domain-containing protein n=1 Tax=Acidiplasma TaxID=507753 RepID=UPI0005E0B100|nr:MULTISPECIES: proton-conducting transporter membrane subunit [unclassified Acidiplasma]KJE49337.1 oxidoreductase [Acidiplasma sp. MBA-1]WMT54722.1 MAG: proton-conducting transporter membrane subunit [Acidiplasma sp.]
MIIVPLIILIIPLIASAFYKSIKNASVAGAFLEMIMLIPLYFSLNYKGFFFITRINFIFILMVSSVYLMSLLYSRKYIEGIENRGITEKNYYLLMNFFYISMEFALMVNNYGFMWVGIETTTISSALLIITEKNDASLEATWRYIIIVSAGVTFAFISVILIYYSFHTLEVTAIIYRSSTGDLPVRLAVGIALVGFGTKVGVFPMHTWLPDAHSEGPAPVSAMFSGVLLPTALYVLYRIYEIYPMPEIFVWAGTVSVLFAALFLTYQHNYKRMFAYSTMENMNMALIGIGTGTYAGLVGSLVLLLAHSFGKAGAFYSTGEIMKISWTKDINNISGFMKNKIVSSSLLISSFAVTGTPPYGTFFGEFLILYSVITIHYYAQFIIILISIFIAFVSINLNVSKMIFKGDYKYNETNGSIIPLISGIIAIFIGIVFLVIINEIL